MMTENEILLKMPVPEGAMLYPKLNTVALRINYFKKIIKSICERDYSDITNYLIVDTDYFIAPASTIYHNNYAGGLFHHSLNVLKFAKKLRDLYKFDFITDETLFVVCMFHDLCKTNVYQIKEAWKKDDHGRWRSYNSYFYEESFPMGHGEKSMYLVQKYFKICDIEALAIRFHMGYTIESAHCKYPDGYALAEALKIPLIQLLHLADLSTMTNEKTIDWKERKIL